MTKQLSLPNQSIHYSNRKLDKLIIYLRAGKRISKAKFVQEKPLAGSEREIIEQIHGLRFNPKEPYVITGGHFYQLYVRNLGIFFNALLDPRIPTSEEDWIERQKITLKTIQVDMEVFSQAGKEFTTIIPLKKNVYSCFNFYTRPSDSLFGILYTLLALTDDTFIETVFPAKKIEKYQLQTKDAATKLIKRYKNSLEHLIETYSKEVIDPQTGLIRKDITLASARDGIKRESSFYDNVIAWATIKLASKLQLYSISEEKLKIWRKNIIKTFWDQKEGIFLDDLSDLSQKDKLFCSDSFIVTSTNFLQATRAEDREYLKKMIAYVKKKKLDKPFPIPYSIIDIPKKLYRPVRHSAPSYVGTSIWSHWGMEYIKTLIYVGEIKAAKEHLETYKHNIEHYGGYPELYDRNGKILQQRLYRSVLHNGWVINYEQTKMLLSNSK